VLCFILCQHISVGIVQQYYQSACSGMRLPSRPWLALTVVPQTYYRGSQNKLPITLKRIRDQRRRSTFLYCLMIQAITTKRIDSYIRSTTHYGGPTGVNKALADHCSQHVSRSPHHGIIIFIYRRLSTLELLPAC